MKQEDALCGEGETTGEFTYLDDRLSTGGMSEAGVTLGTGCKWVKLSECVVTVCREVSS